MPTLEEKKARYLEYAKEREEIRRQWLADKVLYISSIAHEAASDALIHSKEMALEWAGRFADGRNITIQDAMKLVTEADMEDLAAKAAQYIRQYGNQGVTPEFLSRYNATMRISRSEYLMRNIDLALVEMGGKINKGMWDGLTNMTMNELIRQSGILGMTVMGKEEMRLVAEQIAGESFQRTTFSERIWNSQYGMSDLIQQGLARSLLLGEHPSKWAKTFSGELTDAYKGSIYAMNRLAITEATRAQVAAQREMYKRGGYKKYEYIAEPTACEVCASLDGKIFDVETMLQGFDSPPIHPHCRCSTAAYADELIDEMIEELEEIVENQPPPKTLENLDQVLDKLENIFRKSMGNGQFAEHSSLLKDIIDANDFGMRVPGEDVLTMIMNDNQFRNQFETNTSEGTLNHSYRKTASKNLFAIKDIKAIADSEFEKYGYLCSPRNKPYSGYDGADGYGDILVRFKKKNLMDRTTFTVGDSLDPGVSGEVIASRVTAPKTMSVPRGVDRRLLFDELFDNPGIAPEKLAGNARNEFGYFELQYHGKLTMDDVESVSFSKWNTKPTDTTINRLKRKNIKVYFGDTEL